MTPLSPTEKRNASEKWAFTPNSRKAFRPARRQVSDSKTTFPAREPAKWRIRRNIGAAEWAGATPFSYRLCRHETSLTRLARSWVSPAHAAGTC
jgi:hypothetical protein